MPCTLPYGGGGHMLPAAVLAGESALVLAGDVGHARIQRSQRQCCQSTCAHGQMFVLVAVGARMLWRTQTEAVQCCTAGTNATGERTSCHGVRRSWACNHSCSCSSRAGREQ